MCTGYYFTFPLTTSSSSLTSQPALLENTHTPPAPSTSDQSNPFTTYESQQTTSVTEPDLPTDSSTPSEHDISPSVSGGHTVSVPQGSTDPLDITAAEAAVTSTGITPSGHYAKQTLPNFNISPTTTTSTFYLTSSVVIDGATKPISDFPQDVSLLSSTPTLTVSLPLSSTMVVCKSLF